VNYLPCWSFIGERKYQTNGLWNIKMLFKGTPASVLPFLAALMLAATLGFVGGVFLSSGRVSPELLLYIPWGWGINFFLVGLCWWASLLSTGNLPGARRLGGLFFILVMIIFSAVIGIITRGEGNAAAWAWHPVLGAYGEQQYGPGVLGHGLILWALGGILLFTAERKRRKIIRASYE
jgi:hypothetical protein